MDLPSYAEITLNTSLLGLPSTIKLEGEAINSEQGTYAVYIRDLNSCLLIKADVNTIHGTIRLQNSTGQKFLEVKSVKFASRGQKFQVFHNDMQLGTGVVLDPLTMKLSNTYENRLNYIINSTKVGDIALSRILHAPPICNMHISDFGSSGLEPSSWNIFDWNGVMTFPDETVTRIEQCLCIALAMVYRMSLTNTKVPLGHGHGQILNNSTSNLSSSSRVLFTVINIRERERNPVRETLFVRCCCFVIICVVVLLWWLSWVY